MSDGELTDATLLQFGDNPFGSVVLYDTELKVYRKDPRAQIPTWATEGAACFDIAACFTEKSEIQVWDNYNIKENVVPFKTRYITPDDLKKNPHCGPYFVLRPGHRALVPTGLIFDIPDGYSLRGHPRSGLALKQGLTLGNAEMVIDSDYFHETMVILVNTSSVDVEITDGDRVAQAELVRQLRYTMVETNDAPQQKTNRTGGFGHSGR